MGLTSIILAAGVGKRLGPEGGARPKAVLDVAGETLIGRLLRQLRQAGVDSNVVVVGHAADAVSAAVASWSGVRVRFNREYRRGAILSLWTAREFLDRPVLVMDADVFGPDEMIARLVRSPQESCFLLDGRVQPSGEEQMLMARDGRVWDIARKPRGEWDLLGESVGFLKLSAAGAVALRELLEERVARGETDIEHEEVYPELLQRVVVGLERVDDLDWTEVDFPEDLDRARAIAAKLEPAAG